MGDGINRILTIILALVNVKDGYLFIDEFENGIHYSVQKDLLKIIFYLAEKLSIQIFANTHSNDCINAFLEVINDKEIKTKEQFIRLENKNGEIREIPIIVDADENPSKIWNDIKKYFSDLNYNLPKNLPKEGLIIEVNSIKIGVWIMPNNNLKGTLEDFIHYLIPQNDLLIDEVEIHLQSIENKKLHKYNSNNRTKAKIHSWLSLQKNPGNTLGEAINQKYFDLENSECDLFIEWLNKLFN